MISDDYIMGFVEGEGCFSIGIGKYIDRKPRKTKTKAKWKKASIGIRVSPSFRITAVEDENEVLYVIKEKLGVGRIYTQSRKNTITSRPVSHYYVQTMTELDKIIDFFKDKIFYTSKGNSFQFWVKCINLIKSGKHLTKEGLLEICEIRDKMNYRKVKNSRKTELIRKLLELAPEHIETHVKQQELIHNSTSPILEHWYKKEQGNYNSKNGSKYAKSP